MSQYRAKKGAAESLIANINSQYKLSTGMLRRENRKIRYENEILKGHALEGVAT
jgi:hypothetical protein